MQYSIHAFKLVQDVEPAAADFLSPSPMLCDAEPHDLRKFNGLARCSSFAQPCDQHFCLCRLCRVRFHWRERTLYLAGNLATRSYCPRRRAHLRFPVQWFQRAKRTNIHSNRQTSN